MNRKELKNFLRKTWYFIWEDNSIWSWIVNILLAFVLIKFLVYPSIGLLLGTTHPVVAVMSNSMEHEGSFDDWWNQDKALCQGSSCSQAGFYAQYSISKEDFLSYRLRNGFNTGDIIVVAGIKEENIKKGDIVVYWSNGPIPIIHRVIAKWEGDDTYFLTTKGDNNRGFNNNEKQLDADVIVGKAVIRIPYLGWIKIGFVRFLGIFGVEVI